MTVALNPRFTFETFVVGPANRLAVTAARSVAENPGTTYNPLFIYSASGMGKTHLLMAIGARAQAVAPAAGVEYLTLEEFVEAFHAAVAAGQGEAFRHRFAGVDLILIDDVQFLATRLETQSELLRLLTQHLGGNRQVVLASDRPPQEIEHLDERLISRFAGGLVVDIAVPEFETRLAILRRKADERGVDFEQAVLSAVAEFEARNVRELLGLLNRLIAFQAVNEGALTADGARTLLGLEAAVRGREGGPGAAAAAPAGGEDEFAEFLTTVGSALARQVETWRRRLQETVEYWEGHGYRTARLKELLAQEAAPVGAEAVVGQYERDVERLQALEHEMGLLEPARAGDPVFRDPDRLAEAETLVRDAREGLAPPPGPSATWAFEDFVGTAANQLAAASARDVAERPGVAYNPLVIVGGSGVGKTHLLHAIGHALAVAPDALVACLSAQDFLDELVQAIERNRLEAWRSRYRRATAFLLDDVQLLAGKQRSQEELFNLFNVFSDADRQLVFTASAPPRMLEGLDDRLVSRLEGGLVAEILPPDRELRLALATRELAARLGAADADLAAYLADQPATSLRSVSGAVQRVAGEAESRGVPPTAALARELFEGPSETRRAPPRLRTSGVVVSPGGGIRSREKVIWRWPNIVDRMIEER
ncbi:MAG TPA: DnaA/Hda family protein [Gemmatimonadales bacterium]|nr:DnaA/Hda family protein [Gemmatimonadales bacterium]